MADERKARYRDMSEGLMRQRRNLLFISFLLPLIIGSGANIEKINLLGTVININNPDIIQYLSGILFLYFLLRYWQYYTEETFIKDMHREFKEYKYNKEDTVLRNKIKSEMNFIQSNNIEILFANPLYFNGSRYTFQENIEDEYIFPFNKSCTYYTKYGDINHYVNRGKGSAEEEIEKYNRMMLKDKSWTPIYNKDFENKEPLAYQKTIQYNIIYFKLLRIYGYLKFTFSRSYFTDYQLPFFIALGSSFLTIYYFFNNILN